MQRTVLRIDHVEDDIISALLRAWLEWCLVVTADRCWHMTDPSSKYFSQNIYIFKEKIQGGGIILS